MRELDQPKPMSHSSAQECRLSGIVMSFNATTTCYTIKQDHTDDVLQVDRRLVTRSIMFRGANRRAFFLRPLLKYYQS